MIEPQKPKPEIMHNLEIREGLSQVDMVCIAGPSGIGKNAVAQAMVDLDNVVAKLRSHTTREIRDGEIPDVTYVYHDFSPELASELQSRHEMGNLVQYAKFPGSDDNYKWTEISDYNIGGMNVLDTLPESVDEMRQFKFRDFHEIVLVSPPSEWFNRFEGQVDARVPGDFQTRLAQAAKSIDWALNNPNAVWVVNRHNQQHEAAREILNHINYLILPDQDEALAMARQTLDEIKRQMQDSQ